MDEIDRLPTPPRARREEVLRAIAGLPPGAWIAADADNTLWSGDVGDEVVRIAATPPHAPWSPGAADPAVYSAVMAASYEDGCRYSARVLASVDQRAALDRLRAGLAGHVLPRQWLVDALVAAQARGVQLVVVSASPLPIVRLGLELAGLPATHVIALECVMAPDPAYVEPVPVAFGKPAALAAQGLPRPDLGLGDSRWDLPLLHYARAACWLVPACEE